MADPARRARWSPRRPTSTTSVSQRSTPPARRSTWAGGPKNRGCSTRTQSKVTLNDRDVTDQATLINSSALGEPVHQRLRSEHHLAAARGKASRQCLERERFHHDHRRSAHLQGRRAARERLRSRLRQAPARPLPAGGERGDRHHAAPAAPHRSGRRRRRQGQSEGEGGWRGGRCSERLGDGAGRQPRQQDQPARIATWQVRGRAAGQPRQSQGRCSLSPSRKRTRSSASCSASCWPRSPPTCSAASIDDCARWRASRRSSRRRSSPRCPTVRNAGRAHRWRARAGRGAARAAAAPAHHAAARRRARAATASARRA